MSRLKNAVHGLRDRIDRKFASMIVIDGQMGQGKTTLAVKVAEEFQGGDIDFEFQYSVGAEDFIRKYEKCIKIGYKVIIYDEAGDFNKRGALSSFNNNLNRVFETFRTFNILIILVLPFFAVLETHLFDKGVPRLLLNCYGRNNERGLIRAYGLYKMLWLKHNVEYYRKNAIKQHCYKKTSPNFRSKFTDLSPDRSKMLDEISTRSKHKTTQTIIDNWEDHAIKEKKDEEVFKIDIGENNKKRSGRGFQIVM